MRFEYATLKLDLRTSFWYRVAPASDVPCLEAARLHVAFALWESDPAHCSSKEQAVSPCINVRREARASDVGRVSSYPVVSVTTSHVYPIQPADDSGSYAGAMGSSAQAGASKVGEGAKGAGSYVGSFFGGKKEEKK